MRHINDYIKECDFAMPATTIGMGDVGGGDTPDEFHDGLVGIALKPKKRKKKAKLVKEYFDPKKVNKYKVEYKYHPKDLNQLKDAIREELSKYDDYTYVDLNCIDTSKMMRMDYLFTGFPLFNGDISGWDVSNVVTMSYMFYNTNFDGDLSKWDVSNVRHMSGMFQESAFTGKNGGISDWDVSNVKEMNSMFEDSEFTGGTEGISQWDVRNVEDAAAMFAGSPFNKDISNWNVPTDANTDDMFAECPLKNNPPKWYED